MGTHWGFLGQDFCIQGSEDKGPQHRIGGGAVKLLQVS